MNLEPTIIRQAEFWTRESVEADPGRLYLFGDNEAGVGTGGQACIRGLANAFGVPTLRAPGEFWTDETFKGNVAAIDAALAAIPTDKPWVVSQDGLGTGLAELPVRAPLTYRYLVGRITSMESAGFVVPDGHVLILRSSGRGRVSRGFAYPEVGLVECPDWDPRPACGGGLHGLEWGKGNLRLLNWDKDAIWQVVCVAESDLVRIDDEKVKFSKGSVVYSGDGFGAVGLLVRCGVDPDGLPFRQASSSGYASQASSSGDWSQASSSGDASQASSSGYRSQASSSGDCTIAIQTGEDAFVGGAAGTLLVGAFYDGNKAYALTGRAGADLEPFVWYSATKEGWVRIRPFDSDERRRLELVGAE